MSESMPANEFSVDMYANKKGVVKVDMKMTPEVFEMLCNALQTFQGQELYDRVLVNLQKCASAHAAKNDIIQKLAGSLSVQAQAKPKPTPPVTPVMGEVSSPKLFGHIVRTPRICIESPVSSRMSSVTPISDDLVLTPVPTLKLGNKYQITLKPRVNAGAGESELE